MNVARIALGLAACWLAACRTPDPPPTRATSSAANSANAMTPTPSIAAAIHLVTGLPSGAPTLVVAPPAPSTQSIANQFRAPFAPSASQPFRVLVQAGVANSPDRLAIHSARVDAHRITVDLEHRAFEGILGGNLQSTVVIELAVDGLPAATYELALTTHRLGFQRLDDPDSAVPRDTTAQQWTVVVKP